MKKFVGMILIYFAIFDAFLYNFMNVDIILHLTGINFFDLPLILFLLTSPLVYGFIASLLVVDDIRTYHIEVKDYIVANWQNIKSISLAVLIAVSIRTFIAEPFNIPSGSMKPNLLIGDFLFVSKWSYGYSKHSLPYSLPLIPGKIFNKLPSKGDVVVFRTPTDNKTNFIKRVIGLPGDKIKIINGKIEINGNLIYRKKLKDFFDIDREGNTRRIRKYKEYFFDKEFNVLDTKDNDHLDNVPITGVYEVPKDHIFVMGDHRDNSSDSRIIGYVPINNLIGKAQFIFFSLENSRFFQIWKWPTSIRFERLMNKIK